MTSSTANLHASQIDAVVDQEAGAGGSLVVDAKTNNNSEGLDPDNLKAIADDTNGAGSATAKVGQTGAVVSSPLTAGSTLTVHAAENLGLSATATTTSNNATAKATLGTTPREGEDYTNGGILGSNLHAGGAILADVIVDNRTSATASSTSHPGSTAANAEAKLSDSYGIVDSNIQGSGIEIDVENHDSLISSADTSSDSARATTTRGDLTGIQFGEDQGIISSGNANVHVEVGTRGRISKVDDSGEEVVSELDPNHVSAAAIVDGDGDARATLTTGNNYGITTTTEIGEPDTLFTLGGDTGWRYIDTEGTEVTVSEVISGNFQSSKDFWGFDGSTPLVTLQSVSSDDKEGFSGSTKDNGGNAQVVVDAQGADTTLWTPKPGSLINETKVLNNEGSNLYAAKIVNTDGFDIGSITGEGFNDNFLRVWVNGHAVNITPDNDKNYFYVQGTISSSEPNITGAQLSEKSSDNEVNPWIEGDNLVVVELKDRGGDAIALFDAHAPVILASPIEIAGDAHITAEVANTFTTTADTSTGASTATAKTSGADGDQETIGIDLVGADIAGDGEIVGVVDNEINTTAKSSTGTSTATSISGLTEGIRAMDIDVKSDASITGQVHSDVTTSASTHGNGKATATAKAERPDSELTFGGQKIGVDVGNAASANATLTVNGKVESEFDVDASTSTGAATATAVELQVTGVLANDLSSHGELDLDGNAVVKQDAKASTNSGGNATAKVISGPNFNNLAAGQFRLDGITGVGVLDNVDGQSSVDIDGKVDYTGTATAENNTGNAVANVGSGSQSIQDMVGTLLVTEEDVNSGGDLTINGTAEVNTKASADTHSGAASAEVNSDPVKGVKSNAGVTYHSDKNLIVNGQATFKADVDASSTGVNGNQKNATAKADLENTIGTDLSDLNSSPRITGANKLEAHGTIKADGHARTDLNAKADNATGSANASTVTQTQQGLIVSDNSGGSTDPTDEGYPNSYPSYESPSETSETPAVVDTVIQGSGVELSGSVNSKAVADASTHGDGSATATAKAERPDNTLTFGGEKLGVSIDKTVSTGTLKVDGKVESEFDVDARNSTGSATATAVELQVTGVLSTDLSSHGELDLDGNAVVKQDAKASTNSGGNATAKVISGPNFNNLAAGQFRLDGITGVGVLDNVDGQSSVDIDGKVDYTGTATAENNTGNAVANVGSGSQSIQDMVGTLLVTEEDVNSGGDLTINGTAEVNTKASADTHSGAASAEVNSDPVKGVKSNAGVTYHSDKNLIVNGQATFKADVDASSTGVNGNQKNATAKADLENTIGTDLSDLNSSPRITGANKLEAHGTIKADGHARTDLNAKADNATGSANASTVTQTQQGLIVSDNSGGSTDPTDEGYPNSYPSYESPSETSETPAVVDTVIQGSGVELSGSVNSKAVADASTHGDGSATATAKAERPDNTLTFGGEKLGVSIDKTVSTGTLKVDGKVESEFDVDARNSTGSATATAVELQVTGVLSTDLSSHGELDLDGNAVVKQDAKASTNSGGNATAKVISGPNFNNLAAGQFRLDGITGVGVLDNVDGQSSVDIDGKVDYTGTATAENNTGNAVANVGSGSQSIQDMVGTLLVTEEDVNSGGDLTINGTAEVNTKASADTHSGAASAEVNSDPVKGVKSNAGVTYHSDKNLIVNGQATFKADVDASSTGVNGNQKNATAKADLENTIGTDLSDLNSSPRITGANKLEAHGTIKADGHARTDLNAKADNATGSANASTVTQTQQGLIVSDNSGGSTDPTDEGYPNSYPSYESPSETSETPAVVDTVIQGSGVELSGSVNSKAVADASTHGDGSATATAKAERPDNTLTFGGEKLGVSIDKTVSTGTLKVDGKVESEFDVDARNSTGSATATAVELQVTGVLSTDLSSHGELDLDGNAVVKQDAKASTNSGGNATAKVISGPNFNNLAAGQFRLDGITGVGVLDNVDGQSSVDIDGKVKYTGMATAENNTGNATANVGSGSQPLQDMVAVLTVADEGVNSGGDLTINGTTQVDTKASASTHTGSASAITYSDPVKGVKANQNSNYQSSGDLTIKGSASINAQSVASATGGAAERSTAESVVNDVIGIDLSGLNSQPSNNTQSTNSNGDLEIVGYAATDLTSTAGITTGNASAKSFSSLVSGINAETIVGSANGSLAGDAVNITNATASTTTGDARALVGKGVTEISEATQVIGLKDLNFTLHGNSTGVDGNAYNQSTAKASTTSGDATADSGLVRIVGIDQSTIEIKGSLDDAGLVGSAYGYFNSEAESTNGSSSVASIDARAVGGNTQARNSYTVGGNGNIDLDANLSGYSKSTITGNDVGDLSRSTVLLDASGSFLRKNDSAIMISGNGNVDSDGIVSGSSSAYSTTGKADSEANLVSKGLNLKSDSESTNIEIKGKGDVRASGYIGVPSWSDQGVFTLSPFDVEAVSTTGDAEVTSSAIARGIRGPGGADKTISTNGGEISGTGAAVLNSSSKTTAGTSRSTSDMDLFGISRVNTTIGSDGAVEGRALGYSTTTSESTQGDAVATGNVGGIGINGATDGITATFAGDGSVTGVASIDNTVIAKTVTGTATATATSGPVIGIQTTTIHSAGDLTLTASASLNQTANSESVGSMI